MLPKIAEIPELTLAGLKEAESQAVKSLEYWYQCFIDNKFPGNAQDFPEYQELTQLRDSLREEISNREQTLENLFDLTILELRELESRYNKESDYWHKESIEGVPEDGKYWNYHWEARQNRRRIREEIDQRMKFLKGLSKWTMAELALTEARYHQECKKLYQEAETNVNSPSISEKCRKKYFVRLEARDMIRAQIAKRTGQKY